MSLDWGYNGCMPARLHSMIDIGNSGRVRQFSTQGRLDYLHCDLGAWQRQILFVKDDKDAWSEAATATLEVRRHVVNLAVTDILFPDSATEGDNVTIEAVVLNQGTSWMTDLTLRFFHGDREMGEVVFDGRLEKGAEATIGMVWTAVEGNHTVKVEVLWLEEVEQHMERIQYWTHAEASRTWSIQHAGSGRGLRKRWSRRHGFRSRPH